jgi:succinoglycan biosynthesis protein ExoA
MNIVSVIAPCRNECGHIDAFLDAVGAQRLPAGWVMELLVADGMSDDGTRERLAERSRADARLVVIDNPGRIVSTGLNACLAQARGEVIARLDMHTTYAEDYLAQCLAALVRTGADNVGGPWIAEGSTPMQRAIAAAFQSRWVAGGARSRDTAYEGPTETVYLGCWRRTAFDCFGGFDETLVRNQDDEHNLRIVRGGGRVWQSASIRSTYQPRASLARLFAQQRQYGYWRPFVLRKHGQPGSWRQVAPAGLVAAVLVAALLAPWSGPLPLVLLLSAYMCYLALVSLAISVRGGAGLVSRLPAVIAAYQIGYGLGTWQGAVDLLLGRKPSHAVVGLTR